jgi:AraC-like DNA-binding protein
LQKWRLKRVVEYVDNHLSNEMGLSNLAAIAGLSRMHFASQFRVATGLRPHEFLLRRRVGRAEELLRTSSATIVEIALTVGFRTQAHFTTVFKRFVGSTPHQWRAANPGPAARGSTRCPSRHCDNDFRRERSAGFADLATT